MNPKKTLRLRTLNVQKICSKVHLCTLKQNKEKEEEKKGKEKDKTREKLKKK